MPIVLPSRENEWQFAHECMPVSSTRLSVAATSRSRHAISGTNFWSSGLMTPFSPFDGIRGTSR